MNNLDITNFEKEFFENTWVKLTGQIIDIKNFRTANIKTEYLWKSVISALDKYIDQNKIPHNKGNKSDLELFKFVVDWMYKLNNKVPACWSDCWPTTALEINRTNCALGSLVLARALIRAGYQENSIEYGSPGPLSHANIFIDNYYLDQANGVVVPTRGTKIVDSIKCYLLDVDETDPKISFKVPFRLVPATSINKGVYTLISNLDPLIIETSGKIINPEAVKLVNRFCLGSKKIFGEYAFNYLTDNKWNHKKMMSNNEWKKEIAESSKWINSQI